MQLRVQENKIWLSSPTIHGEDIKYITEAYDYIKPDYRIDTKQ